MRRLSLLLGLPLLLTPETVLAQATAAQTGARGGLRGFPPSFWIGGSLRFHLPEFSISVSGLVEGWKLLFGRTAVDPLRTVDSARHIGPLPRSSGRSFSRVLGVGRVEKPVVNC